MADRISALSPLPASGIAGAGGSLAELRPSAILQVQAWPDTVASVTEGLQAVTSLSAPELGRFAAADDVTVAAIAPGRFIVLGDRADLREHLEAGFVAEDAAVTDLGHGRTLLRLDGPAARDVLQGCVAVDLHDSVFPVGRVAQTMIHHVDVTILRRGADRFDLVTLRSFALSLAEWILDAGQEHGIAFAGTPR